MDTWEKMSKMSDIFMILVVCVCVCGGGGVSDDHKCYRSFHCGVYILIGYILSRSEHIWTNILRLTKFDVYNAT